MHIKTTTVATFDFSCDRDNDFCDIVSKSVKSGALVPNSIMLDCANAMIFVFFVNGKPAEPNWVSQVCPQMLLIIYGSLESILISLDTFGRYRNALLPIKIPSRYILLDQGNKVNLDPTEQVLLYSLIFRSSLDWQ